ncbi:Geranylgeranyl transferase type-1 subunit beta [Hanseniaspora osmophila]|uniref:Geranylgeranyl transferase type-1 subunit beta n=1 Tax=Hanseniaspora osmophila TaxID=56408 RepID=A0A1E5RN52_9ASCO|nr:Geranylgeranyl transferase type-1 subunit beta [Hanseniaspora osmophila]
MDDPRLKKKKHIAYFDRFLGFVPASHQSMDINKLIVIYYSLCGQSILGVTELYQKYPHAQKCIRDMYYEREQFAGFLPSSLMDFGNPTNFSLPNTLFGLLCTLLLEDQHFLQNINKRKIFAFVQLCQDTIEGGFRSYIDKCGVDPVDIRYSYMAVSILHILGCRTQDDFANIINTEKLLDFIENKCYCTGTGGFSKSLEPHAGYTSCVAGIYHFLGRQCPFKDETTNWLVHRQVCNTIAVEHLNFDINDHGGIQGRENKFADTCYAFWCINSINYFGDGNIEFFDIPQVVEYLLEKTQNKVLGGFSKTNEDDSDVYHSFLGVATLGLVCGTFNGFLSLPKSICKQIE